MKVDVAINVYGKPFQTAVALLSLLKHSGQHIGKIFFITEPEQPGNIDFQFIYDLLADRIIVFTPKYWNWCDRTDETRFSDVEYRRSIRYQYAWEESKSDYLFLTHNDVLYFGDIIGDYVTHIGDKAAIGEIGQCWNCPASSAGLCSGDRYWSFRPSASELVEIYQKYPTNREGWGPFVDDKKNPWPLPECRVNEWAALINLRVSRPETVPIGDAFPFGSMTLDIGTKWFRDMSLKGFEFANRSIAPLARHGWASEGAGHPSMFDYDKYDFGERSALSLLVSDFGLDESTLTGASGRKWRTRLNATLLRRSSEVNKARRILQKIKRAFRL